MLKQSFAFCYEKWTRTEFGFPAKPLRLSVYLFLYLSLHRSPHLTGLFSRWHFLWQTVLPRLRLPTAFMTRPNISRHPSSTGTACFSTPSPPQVPLPYAMPLSCNLEQLWPSSITAGIYIIPHCLWMGSLSSDL